MSSSPIVASTSAIVIAVGAMIEPTSPGCTIPGSSRPTAVSLASARPTTRRASPADAATVSTSMTPAIPMPRSDKRILEKSDGDSFGDENTTSYLSSRSMVPVRLAVFDDDRSRGRFPPPDAFSIHDLAGILHSRKRIFGRRSRYPGEASSSGH